MGKRGAKAGNNNDVEIEMLRRQNEALSKQLENMTDLMKDLRQEIAALRKEKQAGAPSARAQENPPPASPPVRSPTPQAKGGQGRTQADDALEGWGEIKRKKNKKKATTSPQEQPRDSQGGQADPEGTTKPGLRLRAEEWPIPVLSAEVLKDGAEGVVLLGQGDGEKYYENLAGAAGRMGLITSKPIDAAGGRCRELSMKAVTAADRLVVLPRHITTIGEPRIRASYERTAAIREVTLEIEDKSVRVVLKVAAVSCKEALFEEAKKEPQKAIAGWLEKHVGKDSVLHKSRPSLKTANGAQWIECVLSLRSTALDRFHKASGRNGVFTRIFRTGEEKETKWRIVKFEAGTTVEDALSRVRLHDAAAHGLDWGPRGLGVRVPTENLSEHVRKLFGEDAAKKEAEKINGKVYEIKNLPPWVEFEDVSAQLQSKMAWGVDLVRVARGWNTKRFLVRSSTPPPKDVLVIDTHWCPIQPAPEREKREVKTMRQQETRRSLDEVPPRAARQPQARSGRPQAAQPAATTAAAPPEVDKFELMMEKLWVRMDARLKAMDGKLQEWEAEEEEDEMEMEGPEAPGATGEVTAGGADGEDRRMRKRAASGGEAGSKVKRGA